MGSPTCFLSYSWDDDAHRMWVVKLGESLRSSGVDAHLDQWDAFPGIDLTMYMETQIRESDFVVLVCTPRFADKANRGNGGVGYEKMIVTGELFAGVARQGKFVPVLRRGDPAQALPSYLQSRLYVDFRDDTRFGAALGELLPHLHSARPAPPPLGVAPTGPARTAARLPHLQALYTFASARLGYTTAGALAWAEAHATSVTSDLLPFFESLFAFAMGELGYTGEGARAWAEAHLRKWNTTTFAEFREWFSFAVASLGYTREGARAWAEGKTSK